MESDSRQLSALPALQQHSDLRLGFTSFARSFLAVVGIQRLPKNNLLDTPERSREGLVLVFPGIEGHSEINQSIVHGLAAAGLPYAIRVQRWCRFSFWNPFHLTMEQHNRRAAMEIAESIRAYQRAVPNRPIHLIGHSAGAGMVLFVLEALAAAQDSRSAGSPVHPEPPVHPGPPVDSAILLAAAVSRRYSLERPLKATRSGIWNISSPLDFFASVFGTCIFGTMDRRHQVSIGAIGTRRHRKPHSGTPLVSNSVLAPELTEIRFSPGMIKSWNLGGHFGCTNSVFVKKHVAPILRKP